MLNYTNHHRRALTTPCRRLVDLTLLHHPRGQFPNRVVRRLANARLVCNRYLDEHPVTNNDVGTDRLTKLSVTHDATMFLKAVMPFAVHCVLRQHECIFCFTTDSEVATRFNSLIKASARCGPSPLVLRATAP